MCRVLSVLLLLMLPAAARADWYEASTRHFVVYSDQRPERLREFTAELEKFDMAVRKLGGWTDESVARPNRLTVYVVAGRDVVARLAGNRFVAGFYKPRAGGNFAVVPLRSGTGAQTDLDAESILFHEYTHHLMWSISPHTVYPTWFVEGFAELFATADFERNGGVALGRPPQYRARTLMRGNALPVDRLLRADTLKLTDEQRNALYGRGWLLTHYLMIAGNRPGQLGAYLGALNAGKSPGEAAQAFGDLTALDAELERYKRGRISAYLVEGLPQVEVALRPLTPGEAATMAVRIRSKNGVNARTAPGVLADARAAAAPFPNDAGAQLVLAEAAFDARDYAAAQAAADRAIAADADATDGWLYKAMAQMALARQVRHRSRETLNAIRKTIAQANKLEPDDPKLLIAFYRSFIDFGMPPSENARLGLARAFELAPQDDRLRFNTARMFLAVGNKVEARRLLAPLAYDPHGKGLAPRAAAMIATIDRGDVQAAIRSLDAGERDAEQDGGADEPAPRGADPPAG